MPEPIPAALTLKALAPHPILPRFQVLKKHLYSSENVAST